ncbi:MAG: hypothetical protein SVX43_02695 [Cyanobacteriota bacterium]|nr:hypothetical protein [Cyanobacteriota bacterium]
MSSLLHRANTEESASLFSLDDLASALFTVRGDTLQRQFKIRARSLKLNFES